MALRVAINGLGRIGRSVLRLWQQRLCQDSVENGLEKLSIVALNDISKPELCIHLLNHDSIRGPLSAPSQLVMQEGASYLSLGQKNQLPLSQAIAPQFCQWSDFDVDWVIEASGQFRNRDQLQEHLHAGAKGVLLAAPFHDTSDAALVMGVNQQQFSWSQKIISHTSCTATALATICWPLQQAFGIEWGTLVELHGATADQQVVDKAHCDWRRARMVFDNMIPTSTNCVQQLGLVIPELTDKLTGYSMRIPTSHMAAIDITLMLSSSVTVAKLHEVLTEAVLEMPYQVLAVSHEELVSQDFSGRLASATVDFTLTQIKGPLVRLVVWYDNEWAYAQRLLDCLDYIADMVNLTS